MGDSWPCSFHTAPLVDTKHRVKLNPEPRIPPHTTDHLLALVPSQPLAATRLDRIGLPPWCAMPGDCPNTVTDPSGSWASSWTQ